MFVNAVQLHAFVHCSTMNWYLFAPIYYSCLNVLLCFTAPASSGTPSCAPSGRSFVRVCATWQCLWISQQPPSPTSPVDGLGVQRIWRGLWAVVRSAQKLPSSGILQEIWNKRKKPTTTLRREARQWVTALTTWTRLQTDPTGRLTRGIRSGRRSGSRGATAQQRYPTRLRASSSSNTADPSTRRTTAPPQGSPSLPSNVNVTLPLYI